MVYVFLWFWVFGGLLVIILWYRNLFSLGLLVLCIFGVIIGNGMDGLVEMYDFIENGVVYVINIVENFKCKVKGCGVDGFVGGVMLNLKVWVFESFFNVDMG